MPINILPFAWLNHPSNGRKRFQVFQFLCRICLDSIAPPPTTIIERKSKLDGNILQQNKFELVYNSAIE